MEDGMKIDKEKCIGCEECHPYCTVGAIAAVEGSDEPVSEIDQEECVECGVCLRADVCPVDAIYMPELEWPRVVRAHFSDPLIQHPATQIGGRGTEEIKTNDVTGRLPPGYAGVAIELGRPGVCTTLRDLQTVSMALAKLGGIHFEPDNPVTALMTDPKTGKIQDDVLDEKMLSAIIEFGIEISRLKDVLETLKQAATRIDTVFTVDLASRVDPDGNIPTVPIAKACGFTLRPNTKTNIGLGRA